MGKLLQRCENIMAYTAGALVCIIMCLTTVDVLTRTLFNKPIPGLYEVIEQYLLVGTAFFGMLYAYRRGALVRITVLVDRFPKPARLAVEYFVLGFSFLVTLFFVAATYRQFRRSLVAGAALSEWNMPIWPAYLLIPITLAFLCVAMLMDITKVKSGGADLIKEEGPPGTQSAEGGW
jgi:TRAP-type C4-dicarboxylate transport system permease small subunit